MSKAFATLKSVCFPGFIHYSLL